MSEWKKYKIGDFSDLQNGFAFKPEDFSKSGIPIIKIKNVTPPYVSIEDSDKYKNELTDKLKPFVIKENDILITLTGSTINQINSAVGKVGRYRNKSISLLNQRVSKVYITKNNICSTDYLYHLISQSNFQYELALSSTGSANQANISPTQIKAIEVLLPSISTQKSIEGILNTIRSKIEVCENINTKLNHLADHYFTHTFINNTNGFSEKSLGEICFEISLKISDKNQDDYKVLSAVKTGELIASEDYFTKQVYSKDLNKYKVLQQFDFAYNPARVNIGSIGMLEKPIKGAVSPVYIAFRAKPNWHYFINLMIKQPQIRKTIEVYCSGSVRQVLRFEDFCRIEIKLPTEKKVLEFNAVYQKILNKINHNKQQIEKLTALLESILPRLMTGKIEIKN